MGITTDRQFEDGLKRVQAMSGHSFAKLEPTQEAEWRKRAQPLIDAWLKKAPDGAKVLAAYKAEYEKALKSK
jgi:hypothetical protein